MKDVILPLVIRHILLKSLSFLLYDLLLDCKGHLDFCRTFWMCGTAYDAKVYYAGPPPPCPAPPPNYTPPPPPGECQFSLTKRECGYEKVVGGDTR